MAKKEADVVLRFKSEGMVEHARTLKDINQTMNTAAKEYKAHVTAMGNDAKETDKLRAAKKKLEIQMEGAKKRTEMLREEYEKSVKETGEYSKESKNLYDKLIQAETAENTLKNSLEKTNKELDKQMKASQRTSENIEKIGKAGEKVKGAGEKITKGVTAPIMAVGAASIAAFNEVDEAMDTIITKTGASGDVADRLSKSFENVGSNVPMELQTVGEAIGEVNTQFGFMDGQLEDSTELVLKFAEINETDVSQTAINSRKAIEAYGMSYDDLGSVLDVVTKTAQDTGQSVDYLFDQAIKGAPQLKQLNIGFDEGVTLLGKFEQGGVESTKALSYLSKASVTYAKDGKTLAEGLKETSEKIKNAKSDTEALNIASEVYGTKGASVMMDAIKRGKLNLEDLADAAKNSAGTVEKTFENTEDPIDKVHTAANNAKLGFAKLGEQVQIAMLPVLEGVISTLKKVTQWFEKLSPHQKEMIVKIGLLVATVGPFIVILGSLIGAMGKVAKAIRLVSIGFKVLTGAMATNPFVLIVAAIAGLIAAFVLAYKKVKWFRDGVNKFFRGVKDVGTQAFKFLGGYIGGIFDGIKKNFDNFYKAAKKILNGVINFVKHVFKGEWKKAWGSVVQVFEGIFDGIVATVKAPINSMIGIINGFLRGLNHIKIPKWVPGLGGKGFHINEIPLLAKGGHLINGTSIVGEAGPELLSVANGKTTVTPLSDVDKREGLKKGVQGNITVEQHNHFGKVDANNPSELTRLNRRLEQANRQTLTVLGGQI